ncbi:unnamed protein product [Dovyalis caffra]|uniref:ATP synthase F0 subunit 8 n=1 Tax=Dovyalis caffra TaxID=77055 RepID=A0AAV1S6Z8_9ROSI|nr:unnamed protein product [Dovyalis caffra]
MESSSFSSSSSSSSSLSHWDYLGLLLLRPVLAILFVILFISIGWFLAWKLVLVHVPLVQEIFGLRKKPTKPKPLTRRISRIYDIIDARNSTPAGCGSFVAQPTRCSSFVLCTPGHEAKHEVSVRIEALKLLLNDGL